MPDPVKPPQGFSLSRWSRRKLAAGRPAAVSGAAAQVDVSPAADASIAPANAPAAADPAPDLPPVESLTIDSDFSAFLQPTVDEPVKRAALRKLFSDPRFNVMDGLDVYIDDYGKTEPIAPEVLKRLSQARYILDPPATRVNDRGFVEDVPAEPTSAAQGREDASTGAAAAAAEQPATGVASDFSEVTSAPDAHRSTGPAPAAAPALPAEGSPSNRDGAPPGAEDFRPMDELAKPAPAKTPKVPR